MRSDLNVKNLVLYTSGVVAENNCKYHLRSLQGTLCSFVAFCSHLDRRCNTVLNASIKNSKSCCSGHSVPASDCGSLLRRCVNYCVEDIFPLSAKFFPLLCVVIKVIRKLYYWLLVIDEWGN